MFTLLSLLTLLPLLTQLSMFTLQAAFTAFTVREASFKKTSFLFEIAQTTPLHAIWANLQF